jgi:hypothetical protein
VVIRLSELEGTTMSTTQTFMNRFLPSVIVAGLLIGAAAAADEAFETGTSLQAPRSYIEGVSAERVRFAGGGVSGVVRNRTRYRLKSVQLLIRYNWLWYDEQHPGEDSPARAFVYTLVDEIPGNGELPFNYQPDTPLSQRPDGRYVPSVIVTGYTPYQAR